MPSLSQQTLWKIAALSLVGVIVVFAVLVFVAEQPLYTDRNANEVASDSPNTNTQSRMPMLSGMIIDPIDEQGVPNVFLQVEDTTIVTRSSGRFTFRHVPLAQGVTIHHALVQEDIVLSIGAPVMEWYFDPQLYSLLVAIVDSERYGDIEDIYLNASPSVRNAVSKDVFTEQYLPLYQERSEEREPIKVKNMELAVRWTSSVYGDIYQRAMAFDLTRGERLRRYWFGFDGAQWHYVE